MSSPGPPPRSEVWDKAAQWAAAQVQGLSDGEKLRLATDIRHAIASYEQIARRRIERPADVRCEIDRLSQLTLLAPTRPNIAAVCDALKTLSASALLYLGIFPDERSKSDPINSIIRDLQARSRVPTQDTFSKIQALIADTTIPDDVGGPQEDQAAMALMKRLAHIYTTHTERPVRHSIDSDGEPKAEFTRLVAEVVTDVEPKISQAKAVDCVHKILPLFK